MFGEMLVHSHKSEAINNVYLLFLVLNTDRKYVALSLKQFHGEIGKGSESVNYGPAGTEMG